MVSIASKRSSNWSTPLAVNVTVDRLLGVVPTSTYTYMVSTSGMIPSTIASTVPDAEKGEGGRKERGREKNQSVTERDSGIHQICTLMFSFSLVARQNLVTIVSALAPVLFFLVIAIVFAIVLLLVAYTKNRRLRYEDNIFAKHPMKDGFVSDCCSEV